MRRKLISFCAVVISFFNIFCVFLVFSFLLAQAGYKGEHGAGLVFLIPLWLVIVFTGKGVAVRRSWYLSQICSVMWPSIIISSFILNKIALANMLSMPLFLHEQRSWLVFGAIVIGAVIAVVVVGCALDPRDTMKLETTRH